MSHARHIWVRVRQVFEADIPVQVDPNATQLEAEREAISKIVVRPPSERLGVNPTISWEYRTAHVAS